MASDASPNIVLTGFMGTGKSTIGRGLATRLGYKFVDTDAMIVERHGTIAQIFEKGGEGAFRQLERDTAVELAGRSGCVISTGGRFMLDEHNASVLTPTSDVFALVAEPEPAAPALAYCVKMPVSSPHALAKIANAPSSHVGKPMTWKRSIFFQHLMSSGSAPDASTS